MIISKKKFTKTALTLCLSFVSMKECDSNNKVFFVFIYRVSLKNQGKCSEYSGSGSLYALPENVPDRADEGDFKEKCLTSLFG